MKKVISNREKLNLLHSKAANYYLYNYVDIEEVYEDLEYARFIKRFFIKLHKNKDINVNLLVNHLLYLYNCFNKEYMNKYLILSINQEHLTYLKTILLYMKKIDIKHQWFISVPISYDFDYLLRDINRRDFSEC